MRCAELWVVLILVASAGGAGAGCAGRVKVEPCYKSGDGYGSVDLEGDAKPHDWLDDHPYCWHGRTTIVFMEASSGRSRVDILPEKLDAPRWELHGLVGHYMIRITSDPPAEVRNVSGETLHVGPGTTPRCYLLTLTEERKVAEFHVSPLTPGVTSLELTWEPWAESKDPERGPTLCPPRG